MADEEEKTEEPTGKKIDDSKAEGNVPKSAEVPGAAILFFASVYLLFFSGHFFNDIEKLIIYIYSFIGVDMSGHIYYEIISNVVNTLIIGLFPLFFLVIFMAVIFNVMQFGFVFTPLKLKLDKINPISGMKNLFSSKKIFEALKLFAKLVLIFIVMLIILAIVWDSILAMMNKDVLASLDAMMTLTVYFVLTILLIVIIFAIIDFFFTRHYYFKQLKMSKQEIKMSISKWKEDL